MPNIFIAMVRRSPTSQHSESRRAVEGVRAHGFPLGFEHTVSLETLDGMSLVPWARNLNVAACLALGADWIFICDDDVWWRRMDVAAAIKSELPIVGFAVQIKTKDQGSKALNYASFPDEPHVTDDEWRHIPRIGTGALLVKREVFIGLQKTRPWFPAKGFNELRGKDIPIQEHTYDYFPAGVRELDGVPCYCGEDYGFCTEADAIGYPTFLYAGAVTAHMMREGNNEGLICDMNEIRKMTREGKLSEGERFAL